MRAIAALGVICWHFRGYFFAEPMKIVLEPFYRNGGVMVDFFFVLSGFVLARAYWNDDRRYDVISNLRQRIARLYPLHFVMLLAVVAIQWLAPADNIILNKILQNNNAYNFILNLVLMQTAGFRQGGASFNHPSWSVSTEFLVNIAFMLVITLRRRIAIFAALMLAILFIVPLNHQGIFSLGVVFGFVPGPVARTCIGFFIGTLTYRAYAKHLESRIDKYPAIANGLFVALCLVLSWRLYTRTMNGHNSDILVMFIGFPCLIVLALRSSWAAKYLSIRPMIFLGERSYSIYLVHFPILLSGMVLLDRFKLSIDPASPLVLMSVFLVVIGVATITYRYIELPGKRLLTPRKAAPIAIEATTKASA
ncbi:acyltransferase [Dyella flava]|nr:acyltransferase [Dyella flava]